VRPTAAEARASVDQLVDMRIHGGSSSRRSFRVAKRTDPGRGAGVASCRGARPRRPGHRAPRHARRRPRRFTHEGALCALSFADGAMILSPIWARAFGTSTRDGGPAGRRGRFRDFSAASSMRWTACPSTPRHTVPAPCLEVLRTIPAGTDPVVIWRSRDGWALRRPCAPWGANVRPRGHRDPVPSCDRRGWPVGRIRGAASIAKRWLLAHRTRRSGRPPAAQTRLFG